VEAGEAAAVAHARVRTVLLAPGARAHAAPRRASNTAGPRIELRTELAKRHDDERPQRTHPTPRSGLVFERHPDSDPGGTTDTLRVAGAPCSSSPQRYEKFVVPDGVKKVSFVKDTKVPNAARFVFEREDHTVGNVLRMCASL